MVIWFALTALLLATSAWVRHRVTDRTNLLFAAASILIVLGLFLSMLALVAGVSVDEMNIAGQISTGAVLLSAMVSTLLDLRRRRTPGLEPEDSLECRTAGQLHSEDGEAEVEPAYTRVRREPRGTEHGLPQPGVPERAHLHQYS